MYSTHVGNLPLPNLPNEATQALTFPDLGDTSLLSLGQLCNAGCRATLDKSTCTIQHPNGHTLRGQQDPNISSLWTIPLPTSAAALPAMATGTTTAQTVAFTHASLFSPTLSTLQQALQWGILPDFPGLSAASLKKHPPRLHATQQGHLDNKCMHQNPTLAPLPDDPFPKQPEPNERSNSCFISAIQPKHIVYSNQTGQLHVTSSQGNQYLVVAYNYNSNAILI